MGVELGALGLSVASNLIGKLLDFSLGRLEKRKTAHNLIKNTFNRFIEDKEARLRFGRMGNLLVDYRFAQSLYRLYDDVITIIVVTDGLVDEQIKEKIKNLASFLADIFNETTYDVSDRTVLVLRYGQYFRDVQGNNTLPKILESLEKGYIYPILEEIKHSEV